jgi:hypothetical protein
VSVATVVVLAVDTPVTSLAGIEHALLDLGRRVALPDDAFLCTHMVRDERPHYAVSLTVADGFSVADVLEQIGDWDFEVSHGEPFAGNRSSAGLRLATREAFARDGGRALRFPGWDTVRGTRTVGEIVSSSAIARLEVLGGVAADPDHVVHTRDFVRPLWRHGELVLPVLPSGPGAVAPFEVPNPTPCCGDHA